MVCSVLHAKQSTSSDASSWRHVVVNAVRLNRFFPRKEFALPEQTLQRFTWNNLPRLEKLNVCWLRFRTTSCRNYPLREHWSHLVINAVRFYADCMLVVESARHRHMSTCFPSTSMQNTFKRIASFISLKTHNSHFSAKVNSIFRLTEK